MTSLNSAPPPAVPELPTPAPPPAVPEPPPPPAVPEPPTPDPPTAAQKPPNPPPHTRVAHCNNNKQIVYCPLSSIYPVFHSIVSFFAIYLSFKCNGGFDLASFLMAGACPYLYIVYKFAISENFCGIKNIK